MPSIIYSPSSTSLDDDNMCREAARPRHLCDKDYWDEYDDKTLVYDAFLSPSGKKAILISPPFLNFLPKLKSMTITALPRKIQCSFHIKTGDRNDQIWVDIPEKTDQLILTTGFGSFDIELKSNQSHHFAGKRVLFTQSKNNDLQWISDWIKYYRDAHGANAVLLYDNNSTLYDHQTLQGTLSEISGIDALVITEWPFKYGPQGREGNKFWDSDFCQAGALEHARWIFLQDALSVMNCDIDELVVSEDQQSIFQAVENSRWGSVRCYGAWIPYLCSSPELAHESLQRHRDYRYVQPVKIKFNRLMLPSFQNRCPAKWATVPKKCPEGSQWKSHKIDHWLAFYLSYSSFSYRHFSGINNNWKYDRKKNVAFDPAKHQRDDLLLAHFEKVNWEV